MNPILNRFRRKKLTEAQITSIESLTKEFEGFALLLLERTEASREQSLALTALEEAKFWANQSVAMEGLAR